MEKTLRDGTSRQCRGCGWRDGGKTAARHGRTGQRVYNIWRTMVARCSRPTQTGFKRYGAKGVRVCERWRGDGGLENFVADMGEPGPDDTIDREDSAGHYSCGKCPECEANGWPANCRWAGWDVQGANKSSAHLVSHMGRAGSVSHWERELGFRRGVLQKRLRSALENEPGLPLQEAFDRAVAMGSPHPRERQLTFDGRTMSVSDWARETGLPVWVISSRVSRLKWPVERALTEPVAEQRNLWCVPVEIDGVTRTVREWAEENGLALKTVRERYGKWGDLRRALTQPHR